jgi:drug/metabolite transporter superfamily protein YnfA
VQVGSKQIATTLLLLFAAALLEAGGDALVRAGLRSSTGSTRLLMFAVGGLVLFTYGYVVNAPPWDFGRLLGIYVVFFFVVAQLISWIAFHQPPSTAILVGGFLIIAGGIVISVGA